MPGTTEKLNILVTFKNAAKVGLKGFNTDLKKVDKSAAKAAKSMKGLYTAGVSLAGALAGSALFGSAIKTFADFDDNMRAAAAVTSATTDELLKMTEVAKEMGRETRYTSSNAAEALKFLGMAGFEAAEATKALPGVLELAAAGSLDLGSAADIATNVLSAFGLEVSQLSQVNDVLVKTFTSANVNLVEIGEAFKMVGPIAKGVGADFEDLVATIGALGNAGIKGTMAGTALKGAIGALLNPTRQETQLLKGLESRLGGVALKIKDSEGGFIGFKTVLEQLEKAGLRGDEALALFGERAGPGMAALLNMGSESLAELIKKLKEAGGTSADIAAQMEAGIGGQIRKTISVMEAFKITLGESFGPEVQIVLKAFREWLTEISDSIAELSKSGDLKGWGQAIINTFMVLNWVIGKSIDLLQSWIALLIAVGAAVTGNFALAKEALKGYMKEAKELAGTTPKIKIDDSLTKSIKKELAEAEALVKKVSGPIGKGLAKGFEEGSEKAQQAIIATSDELKQFEKTAKQAYSLATKAAEDYANKVLVWEEKIKSFRISTDDRIRQLGRKLLTDEEQWADRKLQAEEKFTSAKQALRDKDFKLAEQLAKESADLYASLAEKVTKKDEAGKDVVVKTLEDTIKIAQVGIETVGKFTEEVFKIQMEQDKATQASLEELAAAAKDALDEIVEKRVANIEISLDNLSQVRSELNDLAKPVTKIIRIKYLSEDPVRKKQGGTIPGYGGGDVVDALLEKGEGILTKEAVRKYPGLVEMANNLRLNVASSIPKFKYGGIAGIDNATASANEVKTGGGGTSETLIVKFQAGETEGTVKVTDNDSRIAMKKMALELSRMRLVNVN